MDDAIEGIVTIGIAIIGLAILSIVFSSRSTTSNVIQALSSTIATSIKAAVSPLSGA